MGANKDLHYNQMKQLLLIKWCRKHYIDGIWALTHWSLGDMAVTHIADRYLEHFPHMNATRPHRWLVNIGSGNGLVPAGNKPLFNPMLTQTCHHMVSLGHNELTLNVRGPSYLGLTRSISWLLKPWLLASPGHEQPWYWPYRMGKSLSYLRKDFNHLCHINVEEWHKMYMYVLCSLWKI